MKKLLAIILAVVLVVAMVPAVAVLADNDPTIKVTSTEALRDTEVDVKISLENNPGITSAKLSIDYDSAVLELVKKTAGASYATMANGPLTANPFVVNWVDSINPNVTAADFVTLTFKVKADAAIGETPITVTYKQVDVFDFDYNDVVFAVENGVVNVLSCKHENKTDSKENEKTLTCTQDESYEKVVKCDDCGEEVSRETVVVKAAEGHKWGDDHKCTACGESRFTGPTILVTGATGLAGDEVDVKISLEGNPGITSAKLSIDYDSAVLELVKKTAGASYATMANGPLTANPFVVNWVDSINPNVTAADFVTLTFKIKDGAVLGDSAITVTYKQVDVFDFDYNDVVFAVENGAVKVIDCVHANTTDSKENEKELTCTQDESYEKVVKCDDCGTEVSRETVVVKAAEGHKTEDKNAKDATCTEAGKYADKVCTVCGETTETGAVIDALGHDEVAHDAVDPTCTEKGNKAYVTCSRCDYTTFEAVDALGHDEVAHEAKDPTCTEKGNKAYVTCSRCDYTTFEAVDALGHDYKVEGYVAPTCTVAGFTGDQVCTRCNDTIAGKAIDALGHDEYLDGKVVATCLADGYTGDTKCTRCDYEVKGEVEPQLDHKWEKQEAKDPTCEEDGNIEHYACVNGCNQVASDEKGEEKYEDVSKVVIAMTGHKLTKVPGVAATEDKEGVAEHYECTCGKIFKDAEAKEETSKEEVVLVKLSHTHKLTKVPGVAATEDKEGVAEHYECTCGKIFKDAEGKEETTLDKLAVKYVAPSTPSTETPSTETPTTPAPEAPADTDKTAPATNDVANIFVVVAMLVAAAAASVVVLKKKA